MIQNIDKLQDRQYKALTGVSKEQFQELLAVFTECELKLKNQHYNKFQQYYDRKPSAGGSPIFKLSFEKLFFVLYYLKTYPTFDVLGFTFNCSGKTAHKNLYKFLPILIMALEQLKCLPKRSFDSVEEFVDFTKENQDLLIDATERSHHRKKDYKQQKGYYNGKKKMHTVKNTVISNPAQMILFLGFTVLGAKHDYGLFKTEFPKEINWFEFSNVWIDLGYLGFKKDFVARQVHIPFKKPYKSKKNPKPELTPEKKEKNRIVSQTRVKVENAIGGIKRLAILQHKFRNKSKFLRDNAIFIASGIWNFFKGFSFS